VIAELFIQIELKYPSEGTAKERVFSAKYIAVAAFVSQSAH
jgi:hypothetical protein